MLGDCTYFKAINIEPSPIKLEPEPIYHDPKVIPLNKNNSIKEYPDLRGEPNICPNCDSKTYGDIYKCNHCGVDICDSCSLIDDVDVSTGEAIYLCEACYSSAHEDDIEIDVDESSIFDIITSELETNKGED
jgi:hypothetical protein